MQTRPELINIVTNISRNASGAPLHPLHEGGVMLSPMILGDPEHHHPY